jgi:hypothetical protein
MDCQCSARKRCGVIVFTKKTHAASICFAANQHSGYQRHELQQRDCCKKKGDRDYMRRMGTVAGS